MNGSLKFLSANNRITLFLALSIAFAAGFSHANSSDSSGYDSVLFLADLPNPHDFSLFANGGWDGNWYVGYNTCWMQKITVPEKANIARAFVGAKLGRMKNASVPGRPPWEKEALPGEIFVALSSSPSWPRKQALLLTKTDDIPFEPDFENAIENAGSAQWFWREIPVSQIRFGGDNYIALWSPTPYFTSVASAPILAAGWGDKEANSWLSSDVKGNPPSNPEKALATPLTVFEPAIALKLIPKLPDNAAPPKVKITRILRGKARGKYPAPIVLQCSVKGDSIERAWVEISTDAATWRRFGKPVYSAPFTLSVRMEDVPMGRQGKTWVRAAAADAFENAGASEPVNLFERKD